ncbi:MAG: hypothetical protein HY864_00760 [Chloroflexi bacterium]|nr:hypothetical protein [Chloroflexota bacterium]
MTTVFDIALKVAREVMDVIEGVATGGSTTTLLDSVLLAQYPNDTFNNGRLWILSGTHASKVFTVTDFATTTGTVTFAAVSGAIVAGDRYAIAKNAYPWDQIVAAIGRALESTHVTGLNSTLTGDGESLQFTLPSGVYDVKQVEFEDTATANSGRNISHHWKETHDGKLRFDYGYAPNDGDTIHVYYKGLHTELTSYSVTINNEINLEWLKYKAAQELLWWGVGMYGAQVEYRIEERMNKVLQGLKGKMPRREIDFLIHTAGA